MYQFDILSSNMKYEKEFNMLLERIIAKRKHYPMELKGASKEWQIQRKWIMCY